MSEEKKKQPTKKAAPKKPAAKKPAAKKTTPKVDYKKKYKELNEQYINLQGKIIAQEIENQKNIEAFQEKAKGFQSKAQEEINKIKKELKEKFESDQVDAKKYGSQKLLESILEPIINIELAIKAGKNNEQVSAYVMGFEMLINQFHGELESFGLTKIVPVVGDEYDPELHQALDGNSGKIKEVKKNGYKLYDRVIKPAVVLI